MRRKRIAATALLAVLLTAIAACSPAPASTPSLSPSPSSVLLSRDEAIKVAREASGMNEPTKVYDARQSTWAEAPAIGGDVSRAPATGDHPVWFFSIGRGGDLPRSTSGEVVAVIIDAIDGHVIQMVRAIS